MPQDRYDASAKEDKPSLGKLLTSVSMLALTLAPQVSQAAETVMSQETQAQLQEIDLVLSSTRAADTRVDPRLGEKWKTPDTVQGKDGGKVYHYAKDSMDRATAKSVTADYLPPGAPRLTARGVDPNQTTKQYPDGQKGWSLTEPYKECTANAPDGTCTETRWSGIQYTNLSCVYQDEATGEMVRVMHRSTSNKNTDAMNKSVCAGHRLVKDSNDMWGPVQTNSAGETLYVNPMHIIEMEVLGK